MKTESITKKRVIAAIEGSAGIMSVIAKRAGCCPFTIRRKLNKWPELRDLIQQEKDTVLDFAESELIKIIINGEYTMIIFFFKTKGKNRGYVEKIEQAVSVKEKPKLNINLAKRG